MATMSQGNKKITRKIPATNNKALVHTGSLCFFKKYQQPISYKILVGTGTSTQDSSFNLLGQRQFCESGLSCVVKMNKHKKIRVYGIYYSKLILQLICWNSANSIFKFVHANSAAWQIKCFFGNTTTSNIWSSKLWKKHRALFNWHDESLSLITVFKLLINVTKVPS